MRMHRVYKIEINTSCVVQSPGALGLPARGAPRWTPASREPGPFSRSRAVSFRVEILSCRS